MSPTSKGRYVGQVLNDQNPPFIPSLRTQESFKGEIIHSSLFRNAKKNAGKKVLIIGAGVSAHDIAADHVEHGVGEVVRRLLV